MIATDKFNFIHLPKTGGTFVTKMLKQLYKNKQQSFKGIVYKLLKKEFIQNIWNYNFIEFTEVIYGGHQGVSEIPKKYYHDRIVTIARNPFDKYASMYGFKWWTRHPVLNSFLDFRTIPSYPDISIEEMMAFYQTFVIKYGKNKGYDLSTIGYYTWQFILYYCENPNSVYEKIGKNLHESNPNFLKENIAKIHFLQQENLNNDLVNFLLGVGYKKDEIDFISNATKILPEGRGRGKSSEGWKEELSVEMINEIKKKDQLIFDLFPDYLL